MIFNRWESTVFLTIMLFANLACSENGLQSAKCDPLAVPEASESTALEHEVDYKSLNSTSLNSDVAKLYGIEQDDTLGVVMVSVYQTDEKGISVESCVSGQATNLIGQMNRLEFEEIREGTAIYHISTFPFNHKEQITFDVDVQILATGETHELKWKQRFWRG